MLVDTGPLVAYLDRDSAYHGWVCERFRELSDPLLSCQPVLTETLFLLKRGGLDADPLLALVERRELLCDFDVGGKSDSHQNWALWKRLSVHFPQMWWLTPFPFRGKGDPEGGRAPPTAAACRAGSFYPH